ncbi:MAG TPA: RluA family pseudouridine synthase [Candidatus Eisenbacteria bacterium]|nr:RluA family pseudouridine synthase [Candidatus Eisenbacteria bacterium]
MTQARAVRVEAGAPTRLDAFVRAELPHLSRRVARLLIDEGAVRVNGRFAAKGTSLAPGDEVLLPEVPGLAPDETGMLDVLYQDDRVLAVDKPGGIPGHALDPRERGTLASMLLARHPELAGIGDALAPGFVHRLDTGTSGVLLVGRTAEDHLALRSAFARHEVTKRYVAVVTGRPQAGRVIDAALAHDPRDRRRMIAARAGDRAWPAATRIVETRGHGPWNLVTVEIRTGVTHQVRAHLALAGHPVAGDLLYGGAPADLAPLRHALHAARLELPSWHLEVEAPLPDDLARLARDG